MKDTKLGSVMYDHLYAKGWYDHMYITGTLSSRSDNFRTIQRAPLYTGGASGRVCSELALVSHQHTNTVSKYLQSTTCCRFGTNRVGRARYTRRLVITACFHTSAPHVLLLKEHQDIKGRTFPHSRRHSVGPKIPYVQWMKYGWVRQI